jgi:hypothetical protein
VAIFQHHKYMENIFGSETDIPEAAPQILKIS